jgi:hypothetical protein
MFKDLGIHLATLYAWRKTWRLQGEVVAASEKDPEGWSASDKFTVVLESAGLNATELGVFCRKRSCTRCREAAALLLAAKKIQAFWGENEGITERLIIAAMGPATCRWWS